MSLTPSTRLGPYEILSSIGAGGMGEVYRAKDLRLNRDVAIKVLQPAFSNDSERLRRFRQEAQSAGALSHPNILTVYDVGTQDGVSYLVSELLEGEPLRDRLSKSPLPVRKAVDYTIQIARGLAAAHSRGIVHRDLKPENLFVTNDGHVKILDFGLARIIEGTPSDSSPGETTRTVVTQPGVVMGTVGYMSPEQVRGETADSRSDIFSLGVILYEMLTAKRAFYRESSVETMNAILKEDPPELPSTLPAALVRIIHRAIDKKPSDRFESARDLAFALEAVSDLSDRQTVPEAVHSPGRRYTWLLAATLAAALISGGAWMGRRTVRSPAASFRQLTFGRHWITNARFAPDGHTVVYGAWQGQTHDVFATGIESPVSRLVGLGGTSLLSVSSRGEMAVAVDIRHGSWAPYGTLARVPVSGGGPRPILKEVYEADWAPNSESLAVVHMVAGVERLEYPIGKVLFATSGWISFPRFSPQGDRIAFLDHPLRWDDRGSVVVVDLSGKRTILSDGWGSEEGLVWANGGSEICFGASKRGYASSIYAVTLSGRQRLLSSVPGTLTLHDLTGDGRMLVSHGIHRSEMARLAPGAKQHEDVSWFDASFANDISADGNELLFTEFSVASGSDYSVCLRNLRTKAPVVRLADGIGLSLSPDASLVLALVVGSPPKLVVSPTGEGKSRPLLSSGIVYQEWGAWLPDGRRVVFAGNEPGHGTRLWLQSLDGGKAQPVTPEGIEGSAAMEGGFAAVSPDGRFVAARDHQGRLALYSIDGGDARPMPDIAPSDKLIRWSRDGRHVFICNPGSLPVQIYRLDVHSGTKTPWKEIMPADPAGVGPIWPIVISADETECVYSFPRLLSNLYLLERLH